MRKNTMFFFLKLPAGSPKSSHGFPRTLNHKMVNRKIHLTAKSVTTKSDEPENGETPKPQIEQIYKPTAPSLNQTL